MYRRLTVIAVVMGLLCPALQLQAESGPRYAGRKLVDVLEELQRQGLSLIYSDAVVRDDMVVAEEPQAGDPRQILNLILAPFELVAQEAPGGTIMIVAAGRKPAGVATGIILGTVILRGDPTLAGEVTVRIDGTPWTAAVSTDGRFILGDVPIGDYDVVAESPAHRAERVSGVRVRQGSDARIVFQLEPASIFLDEVVVTPSHFKILEDDPESRQFLSRSEVEQMPHVADDLYRAVKRLPGAAGGDYSAQFNVRGGEQQEMLVLLDGVELYEPFHLKDFQSVFSIIDSAAIAGVDLLTGGYPVEYGDRMSGVMDIALNTPQGPTTTTVGVSTLNARCSRGGCSTAVGGAGWSPPERGIRMNCGPWRPGQRIPCERTTTTFLPSWNTGSDRDLRCPEISCWPSTILSTPRWTRGRPSRLRRATAATTCGRIWRRVGANGCSPGPSCRGGD